MKTVVRYVLLYILTLSLSGGFCAQQFSPLCVCDKGALKRNRCDWLHAVIDEPISWLSDPADCFIIDVISLYISAGSTMHSGCSGAGLQG